MIKFYLKELIKMYSGKSDSYFSKKRIESGIAFIIGQIFLIIFFWYNLEVLTTTEILAISTLEFTISGYMINQIQKQKELKYNDKHKSND